MNSTDTVRSILLETPLWHEPAVLDSEPIPSSEPLTRQPGPSVGRSGAPEAEHREGLLWEHADVMLTVAWRLLRHAEEANKVTQETFAEALASIRQSPERQDLSIWLVRITVRKVLERFLRASADVEVGIDHLLPQFDERGHHLHPARPWPAGAETTLRSPDGQAKLIACVESLPLQYRAVLLLKDFEKLSTAETANVLRISEAAVRMRLNRARLALMALLERVLRA